MHQEPTTEGGTVMAKAYSRRLAKHSRQRIERARQLVAGEYLHSAEVLADDMTRELGKLAVRFAARPVGRPVGRQPPRSGVFYSVPPRALASTSMLTVILTNERFGSYGSPKSP